MESSFQWKIEVNDTGRWNELTVKNVGADDVGVYSCHEAKKFSRRVNFTLILTGIFSPTDTICCFCAKNNVTSYGIAVVCAQHLLSLKVFCRNLSAHCRPMSNNTLLRE